jgi:uncharacterized protein (DUF1778 family)
MPSQDGVQDRDGTDQRDDAPEDAGRAHRNSSNVRTLAETSRPGKTMCKVARLESLVCMTYIVGGMDARRKPMTREQAKSARETPNRVARLGFRLDEETKDLIERAAHLSRRKVSDFCVSALTDTARRTIAEHETLALSDRDRKAFFDALINPPAPSERLARALAEHQRRVAP